MDFIRLTTVFWPPSLGNRLFRIVQINSIRRENNLPALRLICTFRQDLCRGTTAPRRNVFRLDAGEVLHVHDVVHVIRSHDVGFHVFVSRYGKLALKSLGTGATFITSSRIAA